MRTTLLFISLFLFSVQSRAQLAPDFTVTDIDGIEHTLYADYLNQDKTVLIKIFFTTCPPCHAFAPHMEGFYQEWGAGEYDVEFFEMTDKSFDHDEEVMDYTASYNSTFPAISVDGNSLATVQPYKSGDFGPWFGTPTFVVIAPDGTVQYGVSGPGVQATLDSLDVALAATGAVKPGKEEMPVSVAGQVQYMEGATGVGNAFVQIVDGENNVISEDTTGSDGAFAFEVLLSEVQADWEVNVIKTGDATNGVSVQDLIKIQKHLLFIDQMDSPLEKLASDANNTGTISALDMVTITKLLLGITDEFPDGESWIVIPADTDFGPPNQHPPVIDSYTILLQDILDGVRQPVFTAIKKGDPQGNADPNN